ncbi:hypothetical protein [Nannocystis radixulma]|uniref:Uncharacterized protein n=1 Tax=Nannocystis radixulma TaxID=2995305 RepID=A0ABT5BLM6_9BACT|nr:hypothetical protein [Nannocystis radixulma]MDC0675061.1 hypothetical protein [Nannocystis radixulma]
MTERTCSEEHVHNDRAGRRAASPGREVADLAPRASSTLGTFPATPLPVPEVIIDHCRADGTR